jgi:hypothetical protein
MKGERRRDHDRDGIEADDADDHINDNVAKRIIDRMRDIGVHRFQIGHAVMVGVQLPQKLVLVLQAVHPIAEEADEIS